jgi:hypothetical protein
VYLDGLQTGTAWYATGPAARQPGPEGEIIARAIPVSFDGTARPVQAGRIRLSAGLRSDGDPQDHVHNQVAQYPDDARRAMAGAGHGEPARGYGRAAGGSGDCGGVRADG